MTSSRANSVSAGLRTASVTGCLIMLGGLSPTSSLARSPAAPCTKAALKAGLHRGTEPNPTAVIETPFACGGRFAFAAVLFERNEEPALFQAVDGRWVTIDRSVACNSRAFRRSFSREIYQLACNSS
jgi:hypothetical protein